MNEIIVNQLRFSTKRSMSARLIIVDDLKYGYYAELACGDDGDTVIKISNFPRDSKRHFEMLYFAEVNKAQLLYGHSFELRGIDAGDLSGDFDSLDDYEDLLGFPSAIEKVVNIDLTSFSLSDAERVLLAYLMGRAEDQTVEFNLKALELWMLERVDVEEALLSLISVASQQEVNGVIRGLGLVNAYALDEMGNVTVLLSKELYKSYV